MTKNVLSIDWDYFMDCTDAERFIMFPDGGNENIGINLSTFIWLGRYASSYVYKEEHPGQRGLDEIGIKEKEFEYILRNVVLNVNAGCHVSFADSHAEIYDFIHEHTKKNDKVRVYNVDHHSDCYNMGDEVNCGNWANKLSDEGIMTRYTWVRGDNEDEIDSDTLKCRFNVTRDITALEGIGWDMIFVCRSSVWSPPHLDKDFNRLYERMNMFMNLGFNPNFFVDRYSAITEKLDSEISCVRQMNSMLEETKRHNKENCDCTEELNKLKAMFDSTEDGEESNED